MTTYGGPPAFGSFPAPVERLIVQFSKLPGIGRKSAQRLAFFVLTLSESEAAEFGEAVAAAKRDTRLCETCMNITDVSPCAVCRNDKRDRALVCVVSMPQDVAAVERTREYKGLYHVLHGVISPMSGKSPDDVEIASLLARVQKGGVAEVILATDPDTEGDTTALYIARLLAPHPVRVTRLAYGIPIGGRLEYSDETTLLRSLEGRREL
ncbi:MAG: recombination mediator RecR [Oscillospiraceae bacterium]|nr:recombination mediator RecR [Oscillospiraceae bacterium]